MKHALVVTGFLAGVAVAAPQIVVLGLFLLIVPGLVLGSAPTVFAYLIVTAFVGRVLPVRSVVLRTATAFGMTLLLGWAVMQPSRRAALAEYRADWLPDHIPAEPIALSGHVRIERPDHREEPVCDYLCLTLLDSPGVLSVTTKTGGPRKPSDASPLAAYRLVRVAADADVEVAPVEPGDLVRHYTPATKPPVRDLITAVKAVNSHWTVRLAGPERLRKVDPVAAVSADWVIRIDRRDLPDDRDLYRVTVQDVAGIVHYRKSYQQQRIPAAMFFAGFRANLSGGSSGARFEIGKSVLRHGHWFRPESSLLDAIRFPLPRTQEIEIARLRDQVARTLRDPAATPAQLDLTRRYLSHIYFNADPQDHPLIAGILADDRVTDLDQFIVNVFSKHKTPVSMRDAIAKRIVMDHSSAELRANLAKLLAHLPPGSFADATDDLIAIWSRAELYRDAAAAAATVADLPPQQATALLDAMLDTAIEPERWRDRRPLVEGIRDALIRMGPRAAPLTPRITELYRRRPSPILNNSGDAQQWLFTLARMGVRIDDLPHMENQSSGTIERNRRRVAEQLRRYQPSLPPDART